MSLKDEESCQARNGQPLRSNGAGGERDIVAELKRTIEQTHLPPQLKELILAELPNAEERERLYREMQVHGGIPFDEFLASLGLENDKDTTSQKS